VEYFPNSFQMNCGAFLLSRRASARLFHTINAVRFSPSHTSSNKISWLVAKGEEVACYDPIYTAKAQNLTIFDDDSEISQDDEGTEMIVETCEDGFISFITHPEKTQPDELIGILSADEEEVRLGEERRTAGSKR